MSRLSRIAAVVKSWFADTEGSWRGPFFGQGHLGNWFQLGRLEDGFQRDLSLPSNKSVTPVYACVMLNARAISQCFARHRRRNEKGGFDTVTTSPASRILRKPNAYETWPQFILNVVANMMFNGEALALGVRDDRFAPIALHLIPRGAWQVQAIDGEVFYAISKNELAPVPDYLVPARDVIHFRMHTPRHPLIGESPAAAASMAIGIHVALNRSQLAFFNNMNRPSGVIETDQVMTKVQKDEAREAFSNQSRAWNAGLLPILSGGAKFKPMNITQADAQLIEQQRMSTADIARVYGVPMALLSSEVGSQAGTEALINHWLSIGLGSLLENVERSLDAFFDFGSDDYVELDPSPLLRVDFVSRIEGLVKAVQGGIMTPDEGRLSEGLGNVKGGDQAFMQQQMVPLTLLTELHKSSIAAKTAPPPPPPPAEDPPEEDDTGSKNIDPALAAAVARLAIQKAMK